MVNKVKNNGEVFTPKSIVQDMLCMIDYTPIKPNAKNVYDNDIFMKHVIDSSCGDGAFLIEIVKRYIETFIRIHKDTCGLKEHLETYIHGIEIDPLNHKKCIENLNDIEFYIRDKIFKVYDLNVDWDIRCDDALTITDYNGKMDYVVGNPPYVRVHNLQNKDIIKSYLFCDNGMTDLYLAFFELSFRQLNSTGKMVFITPNSWLTSNAGIILRDYIKYNKNLNKIADFGHVQVFDGITTYSLISCFNKDANTNVAYYQVEKDEENNINIYSKPNYLISYDDLFINDHLCIGDKKERDCLIKFGRNITNKKYKVKNGFATLADNIFILKEPIDLEYNIPVCKSSTSEWFACVYPYDENGKPITENDFKEKAPYTYNYLLNNKEKLLSRSIKNKDEWYLFGRSQAINDVNKDKVILPNIIKNHDDFIKKIKKVNAGSGVFGGIYILGDIENIIEKLKSPDFMNYIKALRKYKNGGYYTFSSKDLEKYLNNN